MFWVASQHASIVQFMNRYRGGDMLYVLHRGGHIRVLFSFERSINN